MASCRSISDWIIRKSRPRPAWRLPSGFTTRRQAGRALHAEAGAGPAQARPQQREHQVASAPSPEVERRAAQPLQARSGTEARRAGSSSASSATSASARSRRRIARSTSTACGSSWRASATTRSIRSPGAPTRCVTPRRTSSSSRAPTSTTSATSHYPCTQEFLDAADRLGLYVELEAPFCWVTDADDLTDLKAVLTPTSAMIDDCHAHPSVIIYSLANESTWSRLFELVEQALQATGPDAADDVQ